MRCPLALLIALTAALPMVAAEPPAPGTPPVAGNNDHNEVFQYFLQGQGRANLGAWMWVPPGTTTIRAVMVGMHNGLPLPILQHPAIRAVCARHGIAQILMTPWSEDIGKVVKDLTFDFTDPERTAIFDGYLAQLADLSGHPELVDAPLVPLAHSAYASFPVEVALRDAKRCLMAIPIKAGFGNVYDTYKVGGRSKQPAPDLTLEGVPILLCTSMNQSTVPGAWKSNALPYESARKSHPFVYRGAEPDAPGDRYQKGYELCGQNWEMLSCHFDMSEREYTFLADYLDEVSRRRLPATPPPAGTRPTLTNLTLGDGWLVDGFFSNAGTPAYHPPAPYGSYTGPKNRAHWYPSESLARTMEQRMVQEGRRKFEILGVQDRDGQPLSLAENPQLTLPEAATWVTGDGLITLPVFRYTTPPLICTNKAKHGDEAHTLANVLFPGQDTLPTSTRPIQVDLNASPVEVVDGPQFTFRLRPHRLAPDPGGASGLCVRFYVAGDDTWAWSGRNVRSTYWLNGQKIPGIQDQRITFPAIADVPRTSTRTPLAATATSGLPVGYFVRQGPAVIQGNDVVITQVPAVMTRPMAITIGAYQVGRWQEGGWRAAGTVYQTFHLQP